MSTKISSILIKKLFEDKDVFWILKNENVLVGKNGLGKSTILQIIKAAVTQEYSSPALELCEGAQVKFIDKNSNEKTNHLFNPKKMKERIIHDLTNQDFLNVLSKSISLNTNFNEINENVKNNLIEKISYELEKNDFSEVFKRVSETIPVEYISTINMSANSINSIITSDGKRANFLDYEIREEINRLFTLDNLEFHKNNLTSVLNNMFKDSGKSISFSEKKLTITLKNGRKIDYESLSSGERQIIYIFTKVINANKDKALILMDEPEISLHLSWQETLLSEIRKVNSESQIIIVTHSPAIVMNGWMDCFIDIKDIFKEKKSD